MVVTRLGGKVIVTLRGPETRPRQVFCPADGEWFAIRFKAGTFMPLLPMSALLDGADTNMPATSAHSFQLSGRTWEIPNFDNAEIFVARLARAGVIAHDSAVAAALDGEQQILSRRSAQRHFLFATGMTYNTMRQIERARRATNLLRAGVPILDTAYQCGYFDQAHMTRSLRTLIGLTPTSIARGERQLSFLYKSASPLGS